MPRLSGSMRSQSLIMRQDSFEDDMLAPLPQLVGTPCTSSSSMASNVTISSNSPLRKSPQKSSSFQIPRAVQTFYDHPPSLPGRDASRSAHASPIRRPKSTSFRAAESGKGELLPTTISSTSMIRARARSQSAMANSTPFSSLRGTTTTNETQSLRSRRGRTVPVDDEPTLPTTNMDVSNNKHTRHVKNNWSDIDSNSVYRAEKSYRKTYFPIHRGFFHEKMAHFVKLFLALGVTILVLDSYYKALSTTEQLQQFKHDESMLMLHLHRVEQHAEFLHENLGRLGSMKVADASDAPANSEPIDSDLIWKQIQQLRQMEDELSHDVRTLQTTIQASSRNAIIQAYGEGPVQVTLDLDFGGNERGRIAILLWYDTPYSAWALLQQIRANQWDGASFSLDRGRALTATPLTVDHNVLLDFVESSQKTHEAWTVGLSELSDGGLSIFVNLQDNNDIHKHDVCVGKVFDGFDVLQKLVAFSSQDSHHKISIHAATASHLTRAQTDGII